MVIYLVYQQFYADFENGEDDAVFIESAFKSRRKAIKKAKELTNKTKKEFCIEKELKNIRNPFKNNNFVDFYNKEDEQEHKVSSIVLEEIKLVA